MSPRRALGQEGPVHLRQEFRSYLDGHQGWFDDMKRLWTRSRDVNTLNCARGI